MADIKQVALRLHPEVYEQVRLAAVARGVSVHSELVRRIEQAGFKITGEVASPAGVGGSIPGSGKVTSAKAPGRPLNVGQREVRGAKPEVRSGPPATSSPIDIQDEVFPGTFPQDLAKKDVIPRFRKNSRDK